MYKRQFVDSVTEIEVRQRKNTETLTASTQNQLAITAVVSINWTVNKASAMQLFIEYGGLDQFEARILDPKLNSAVKAALAEFPADVLIRNRNKAISRVFEEMKAAMQEFPVVVNSPQIEDIEFPNKYLQAVLAKEQARENAEKEKHTLAQQELVAQQQVNTANASRDSMIAVADGKAYQIKTEATAEAEAIRMINAELVKSPNYVALVKAKRWDGVLPKSLITANDDQSLLYQVK